MISPEIPLFKQESGLHTPGAMATEQEYCTVMYWAIVANRYKDILEIGTFSGHGTWWFDKAAQALGGHVVTVDPGDQRTGPLKVTTKWNDMSHCFFRDNKKTFDFVYVDGGHNYDTAKNDILSSKKVLNKGGMIAVHDVAQMPMVKRALDEAIDQIGGGWIHFNQGAGLSIGQF